MIVIETCVGDLIEYDAQKVSAYPRQRQCCLFGCAQLCSRNLCDHYDAIYVLRQYGRISRDQNWWTIKNNHVSQLTKRGR